MEGSTTNGAPVSAAIARLFERAPRDRRIGRYRLREDGLLGQGGFAPVYLADELTDETADETLQTVALKLFPLDENRARITREGQALCRVKHDNVVTFNTMVTDESLGIVAIVMEHVEGVGVDQRLEKGPLPIEDVIALGLQMASALEAIHAAGVVHRDLKPANVIESKGVYTLIDFGISTGDAAPTEARSLFEGPGALDAQAVFAELSKADARGLTGVVHAAQRATKATLLTHGIAGTLGYVDPRTVRDGIRADEKSDIYALGVTLFECASGILPTVAAARETEILPENRAEVSARIFMGAEPPPSLSESAPHVPLQLASLVDAMISPDAADRPASAEVVLERLEKIRASLKEEANRPRARSAPQSASQPPRAPSGIPVGSIPPQDPAAKAAALRKRDSEERFRRWRNRFLVLLALGALGGGAYAAYKLAFSGNTKDADARAAWADFQQCLIGASPKDAAAVQARWYVVKANLGIGTVEAKPMNDDCPTLGRTAYDKFRAARGPGSDFLDKLSSYLDEVTHKDVADSDPIPLMNAALEADIGGGTPTWKSASKSPATAAVEPALATDKLKTREPWTPPGRVEIDSKECSLWMPPKLRKRDAYGRVWAYEETTIKIGPVGASGGIGDMDAAIKLEDGERVDGAQMICNVPVFLVRNRSGVRLFHATDSGESVVPTQLFPPPGSAETLDPRDSSVRVTEICRTSKRAYYNVDLGFDGLLLTWTDGVFTATKMYGSSAFGASTLDCREGVGAWARSETTLQFCPDGAPCGELKPPAKDGCFDGSAWYSLLGGTTKDGRAPLEIGYRRWAWPFDAPPTTTLLFAATPKQPVELPNHLVCSANGAVLTTIGGGAAVDISKEPRILP